jgi:hypothetical protein
MNNVGKKPDHYTHGDIECIDAQRAACSAEGYKGHLKCQVIKYLWRYEHKGRPIEDIEKSLDYLTWLYEFVKNEEQAKKISVENYQEMLERHRVMEYDDDQLTSRLG